MPSNELPEIGDIIRLTGGDRDGVIAEVIENRDCGCEPGIHAMGVVLEADYYLSPYRGGQEFPIWDYTTWEPLNPLQQQIRELTDD